MVLPGVERIDMVALHPKTVEPLMVTALTRDGVDVRLVVSVLWRAVQPSLVVQAVPDATAIIEATVERVLHQLVANVDLATLLRDRGSLLAGLPVTARPLVTPLGVEIVDVDLLDVEVRVGPELLRLLG
jgi:regulator of protease activity HflC (stomatin/prohibitin superfamily)